MHQLLVTANIPSSLILATLMMEALHSSETSVHTTARWDNVLEEGILPNHNYNCILQATVTLYRVSDASGEVTVEKVAEKPLHQDMLNSTVCRLIEFSYETFSAISL
jgi:hypothetical protein